MFIIAYQRTYRSAQTGSAVKNVHCEQCGKHYSYEVVRRAMGSGSSPFLLCNSAAKSWAQKAAGRKLAAALARAIDPVPCPDCGWFQSNMVAEMRRRGHRWILWIGWGLAGTCWFCALLWFIVAMHTMSRGIEHSQAVLAAALAGIGFVIAGLFVGIRHMLISTVDPNWHAERGAAVLPGAPRGMPTRGGDNGVQNFTAPAARTVAHSQSTGLLPVEPGGWVTIQLARVRYPARCCSCMDETQRVRSYPCGQMAKFTVPLCQQCERRYSRKHWLTQIQAALLCSAVMLAGAYVALNRDPLIYILTAIGGLLVGALFGAPLANRIARPAVFSQYRFEFNTLRVRFRNENYAHALMTSGQLV